MNEDDASNPILPSLGEHVRNLREGRNWSQADLARAAGLSRVYVKHIEDGAAKDPSARTIGALCQALDVHVIDMMQCSGALPIGYHEAQINNDLELAMHLRRQRRLSEEFVNMLLHLIHMAERDELSESPDEANATGPDESTLEEPNAT